MELVRPGPPHNQLLSPLTPYMALCGEGSRVTFHITSSTVNSQTVSKDSAVCRFRETAERSSSSPDRLREARVAELGEEIGRLLGRIPSLNGELARARAIEDRGSEFVHVGWCSRDRAGDSAVRAGSRSAGLSRRRPRPLPAGSLPVVVTREIRRTRPPRYLGG